MNVLVTGAHGFIAKNLIFRLNELDIQVLTYTRKNSTQDLEELIKVADFIVHLAGENRPKEEQDFDTVNAELTAYICDLLRSLGKNIPFILASSTQAKFNNAYGKSKLNAENSVKMLEIDTACSVYVYRLPGVFGKWCKPNYNSVVATFCYNISHNLPIKVSNPDLELTLVYIDDVIEEFLKTIQGIKNNKIELSVQPEYKITLGNLSNQIKMFKESRNTLVSERVGNGFIRKLYSTYVSYLSPEQFTYTIPTYGDDRGTFSEILKTKDSGQFSFFTALPGLTRGEHYHHSKTEKFLVIHGKAKFNFRHIITEETYEIITSSKELKIVETVPGWSHNITNIGLEEMIVLLWANEIFDPNNPDTVAHKV